MDRISGANYLTLGGIRVFQDLNLGTGQLGTVPNALWFTGAQESILAPVTKIGLVPTDADNTQLLQAISLIGGGGMTVVSANAVLTAAEAGIIEVNAAAGPINITLPAAAAANSQKFGYRFFRIDSTSNTVTISPPAGTFSPGANASFQLPPRTAGLLTFKSIEVISDGTTWLVVGLPSTVQTSFSWTAAGSYSWTCPADTYSVPYYVTGGGGGGGASTATSSSQSSAGPGGNGAPLCFGIATTVPGTTYTITVGSGGGGGVTGGAPGGNGGASSFGSFGASPGAHGAQNAPATTPPYASGFTGPSNVSTGGLINGGEEPGGLGIFFQSTLNGQAGNGGRGPWGGGGVATGVGGSGGAAPGGNGLAPGAGGAGGISGPSQSGQNGGRGADGGVYLIKQ
jgi:hypothetical protein